MSLFNFPLDTNNCSITIQSFGYGSKDLQLLWIKGRLDGDRTSQYKVYKLDYIDPLGSI